MNQQIIEARDLLRRIIKRNQGGYIGDRNDTKAALAILEDLEVQQEGVAAQVAVLIEVMRMPNAEHVADAHNAAVRNLRRTFGA